MTETQVPWRGTAMPLPDGHLMVAPRAVLWLYGAFEDWCRVASRDGGRLSPAARELRQALACAASSARRASSAERAGFAEETGKVSRLDDTRQLTHTDPIDSGEVAAMLACTPQWARRLCANGTFVTAVKRSGSWQVERDEVATWAAQDADERTA
jgi:hypothetical protein